MKRFKNILVANYGEASITGTLERAVQLAQSNKAKLTVVEAVGPLPSYLKVLKSALPFQHLQDLLLQYKRAELEKATADLKEKGVEHFVAVDLENPFLSIIRRVLRDGHDLVMVTSEGTIGMSQRIFGSSSLHLMRKCPCPVWTMPRDGIRKVRNVLAAVCPGTDSEAEDALNHTILEFATSLAKMEEADLHVVHAWELEGESLLGKPGRMSIPQLDELLETLRSSRQRELEQLLLNFDLRVIEVTRHLKKGNPSEIIPAVAHTEKIDLLVMGTLSRVGLSGLLIGNTAEAVLDQVRCAVLTLKPHGFVSPIKI